MMIAPTTKTCSKCGTYKSRFMLVLSSVLCSVAVLILLSITVISIQIQAQQPRAASTIIAPSVVNFTKLFTENLTKPAIPLNPLSIMVNVVYQSSTTVVLQGDSILATNPPISITNTIQPTHFDNDYRWSAVDLVKQQGYSIQSVTSYGLNTEDNPAIYTVVLSKK